MTCSRSAVALAAVSVLACTTAAHAAITKLDLANYQLASRFDLPGDSASESSAITYNFDSGNLFVLGDEGDAIVEVTTAGAVVSTMALSGFDDTEGLTYIGNGQFVLVEERLQDAYRLTYTANGNVARSSLAAVSIGSTIGNSGLEGVSFERTTGDFYFDGKRPHSVR